MSVDPIFWLLAAIGFVVLEAMTLNLVSIWFAVGSAAALLSCLVTGSFRVQAVVMVFGLIPWSNSSSSFN